MDSRRYLHAFIAVFVYFNLFAILFNAVFVAPFYDGSADLWRPLSHIEHLLMPWLFISTAGATHMFITIFGFGYQGKGVREGVRYGLYMGTFIGFALFSAYPILAFSLELVAIWFAGALVATIGAGALLGAIYENVAVATTPDNTLPAAKKKASATGPVAAHKKAFTKPAPRRKKAGAPKKKI